ncbi:hypothetical protein PHMEG_00030454 [Phytophthora megakarya]|uniref:Uncharacterized protein n=1 Tax=Phytophthora megakarya TaxID=4795 RepID=A0A225V092_9STRA|nr:hypothetical protein PHMEG_00030454 [Phytophthora megakarya]
MIGQCTHVVGITLNGAKNNQFGREEGCSVGAQGSRRATALLNAGADRLVIKVMGRWLSNAFEDYPVLSSKGSADLSRHRC